ncbi:hypothetical protein [Aquimarina rhabdastrellae]
MKKTILNLGKALNKAEQKEILGGMFKEFDPCPCSATYTNHEINSRGQVCSYLAKGSISGGPFLGGRCLGLVQGGLCCLEH